MFETKTLEHDKILLEQGIKQGLRAVKMLKENADISLVSRITGISSERLAEVKRKLKES